MARTRSLASRLAAAGGAYLVVAVASISLSLWVAWQLEGGAAAVNEAGRLRMLTYRMALDASAGQRAQALARAAAFDRTLELLHTGDPSRPLFVPASDDTSEQLARVAAAWQRHRASVTAADPDPDLAGADALVASVDRLVGAIERQLDRWTALLHAFQLAMVGLAVAGALVLLYMSHVLVLEPLRRVGAAIGALRNGRLDSRAAAENTQEFDELAGGFNAMAQRLESQVADMEASVRLKTADLQAQRERLEALYEVSAFVARADSLDGMARGFATLARRSAHADAIALRWSDAGNERYLLLAQEGLPAAFAAQEQCLRAGDCHCGQPAGGAGSRVIPIRGTGPSPEHCGQAGFRTLLAVPVRLNQQVLGEVDLFYRTPPADVEAVRSLVELLASHLAGGMQGLRAAAADKAAAVSNERGLLAQELHDSIAQSLAFMKIQVELLRRAMARDDREALRKAADEIAAGVRESYGDVRELLIHFRTRADAEDIEPALRTTLHKFHHQTGLPASIVVEGHGVALPNDVQVQVLHVVQEALSNIRKHARAKAVRLRVQQSPRWRFEVSDDGVGFDTAASPDETHVGMRIMAERASRIGATLAVSSRPGRGTTVSLALAPDASPQEAPHELEDSPAGR